MARNSRTHAGHWPLRKHPTERDDQVSLLISRTLTIPFTFPTIKIWKNTLPPTRNYVRHYIVPAACRMLEAWVVKALRRLTLHYWGSQPILYKQLRIRGGFEEMKIKGNMWMEKIKEKYTKFFKDFSGDARELNSVRIWGKMDFFPELDWVQLFRPNIDLLGACSHRRAKPPETASLRQSRWWCSRVL